MKRRIKLAILTLFAAMAIGATGGTVASAKDAHLRLDNGGDCYLRADRSAWVPGPPGDNYTDITNIEIDPDETPCGVANVSFTSPVRVAETAPDGSGKGDIWVVGSIYVIFDMNLFSCEYSGTTGVGRWYYGYGKSFASHSHSTDWGKQIDFLNRIPVTVTFAAGSPFCPGGAFGGPEPPVFLDGWIKS